MFKYLLGCIAAVCISLNAAAQSVSLPITGGNTFVAEWNAFTQQAEFTTTAVGPAVVSVSGYRTNVPLYNGYRNVVVQSDITSVALTDSTGAEVCIMTPVSVAQPFEYKWICSVASLPVGTYTVTAVGNTFASRGPAPVQSIVFSVTAQ